LWQGTRSPRSPSEIRGGRKRGGQREEPHARAAKQRKRERERESEREGLEVGHECAAREREIRVAFRTVRARGCECVTNKCLPAARRTGICIRTHNATPSQPLRSRLASCCVTFPSQGRARSAPRVSRWRNEAIALRCRAPRFRR